jgi:hypothetical protein
MANLSAKLSKATMNDNIINYSTGINDPTGYQQTGNKVPIPITEFTNYINEQLLQYDKLKEATKTEPEYNPYVQPIIYHTKNGKTVQIPKEIQMKAINDWINMKSQNNNNTCSNGMCGTDNIGDAMEHFDSSNNILGQATDYINKNNGLDPSLNRGLDAIPLLNRNKISNNRRRYNESNNNEGRGIYRYEPFDNNIINEEPVKEVVVIEKSDNTIYYLLIGLLIIGIGIIMYRNKVR